MDTVTDGFIKKIIHHQFFSYTLITIADRISSIIASDIVLLLEDNITFISCFFSYVLL